MAISLKTKLGNSKLEISAELRKDRIEQIAKLGLQYLVWHVVPADAYNKDSEFKRESGYSEDLARHLVSVTDKTLAEYFDKIEIKTALAPKTDKIAKLVKEFISLGMSEADAKAMAENVQAKVKASNNETEIAE